MSVVHRKSWQTDCSSSLIYLHFLKQITDFYENELAFLQAKYKMCPLGRNCDNQDRPIISANQLRKLEDEKILNSQLATRFSEHDVFSQ